MYLVYFCAYCTEVTIIVAKGVAIIESYELHQSLAHMYDSNIYV